MDSAVSIRSFIAVQLPGPIIEGIARVQEGLRRDAPDLKWVAPSSIHLTLKFLGNIRPDQVQPLAEVISRVADRDTFEVEVRGLGAFPGTHQPRVIWVGLERLDPPGTPAHARGPDPLIGLARDVDEAVNKLGFEREARAFVPHLTLARARERGGRRQRERPAGAGRREGPSDRPAPPSLIEHLEAGRDVALGALAIDAIHLIRSDLEPGGAVYTVLASSPLGRQ